MGLMTNSFNADGNQKAFTVVGTIEDTKAGEVIIPSKSHIRVHFSYGEPLIDYPIAESEWDLLGSTLLFNEAPTSGYIVKITLSSDGSGLDASPSSVSNVSANIDKVVIVSDISTEVATVSGIEAEILSLYADKITIDSLYSDKVTLDSIYADKDKIDSLYTDKTKLDSIYADKATLDSLFNYKATMDSLYADKITLDSLYSDKAKLDSLYADKTVLDSLYADKATLDNLNANIVAIQNAEDNANEASTSAISSQLKAWDSEASKLTSDSYANEAEDVYVKIYTSNNDGTFTTTNIAEYSSYHWNAKATATATSGSSLLADNNLSDLSDPILARDNLGLNTILDSVTASIANLATAQAVIVDDGSAIVIDTTQQLVPIMTDTPSTDANIIDIDDVDDTLTIKTNASVNFFSTMAFTSSTPNTRNVSIKVVNVADDVTLKCFDMALTIPNGTSDTVAHTFLLTVGKNGTPDAPLTVRFEIVADDTGYTLDSFRAVVATSSSYDVSTDASGISVLDEIDNFVGTNVEDVLTEISDTKANKNQTDTTDTKYVDKTTDVEYKLYVDNNEIVMEEL